MKNINYSPIAQLGDLSQYSLYRLIELLSDMSVKISKENLNFLHAEWSNEFTIITIRYHINGNFDCILREVWKESKLEVTYKESNDFK